MERDTNYVYFQGFMGKSQKYAPKVAPKNLRCPFQLIILPLIISQIYELSGRLGYCPGHPAGNKKREPFSSPKNGSGSTFDNP